MMIQSDSHLFQLLLGIFPQHLACRLITTVQIHPEIAAERGGLCSRAALAQALNLGLLADLLERSERANRYVHDLANSSRKLVFDHGAMRSVDLEGMGNLPAGEEAIARILRPLGYEVGELYPLDRLQMTGRSYRHADFAEDIPQFFVSELHVDRFSPAFQAATARVTASSSDPLTGTDFVKLEILNLNKALPLAEARSLLRNMLACFRRRHDIPTAADYEILLAESAEMAWIATEGNVFNHATDRVEDLDQVVEEQRRLGRAMKDRVEISRSRRVRQTAYRADMVERPFLDERGHVIHRDVPGSFFEFIAREAVPETCELDLSFDSGNAQGIFKMTEMRAA